MKFLILLILIVSLHAKAAPDKANDATKALNSQTFVPKATMDGRPIGAVDSSASASQSQSTPTVAKSNIRMVEILQTMLTRLKPKEDDSLPKFAPNRALHPSEKDDNIPALRQILYTLGYLKNLTDSPFFDMELEDAVKAFQASHCLNADGIIGKDTEDRINWSYAKRIKMLNDSIEKLSQLVFTDRTAIVNICTYSLHAFAGNHLKMRMKVIVGRKDRQTPQMTSYVNSVEFNPVWVVPKTILFEDKIPEIIKDVHYIEKNKLQVFDHENNEIDPSDVNWEEANEHNFPYVLEQESGKGNALGRVKFNLLNKDDVYMHDTPLHRLFKSTPRALSSGCIRLEKPLHLAAWLLDEELSTVKDAIRTKETATVDLEKNLTVYITYLPVLADEEGQSVLWGDDPYEQFAPQPQC